MADKVLTGPGIGAVTYNKAHKVHKGQYDWEQHRLSAGASESCWGARCGQGGGGRASQASCTVAAASAHRQEV